MECVAEVDLNHESVDIAHLDCQKSVLAVLYVSGELVVKDVDDDENIFLSSWVKNPHKVFVHSSGNYVVATGRDGLVHFFSVVDPTIRCTMELKADGFHRVLIANSIGWITDVEEKSKLTLLVGTLNESLCFRIALNLQVRSVKHYCSLLKCFQENVAGPISSVFYARFGDSHTVIITTPNKLFYCCDGQDSLSAFLDSIQSSKLAFQSIIGSDNESGLVFQSSSSVGILKVFGGASKPRSFMWTHSGGVIHGVFLIHANCFFKRLERIDCGSPESWKLSPIVQLVATPAASHMVFLVNHQCFAVQHPAGLPWSMGEQPRYPLLCSLQDASGFNSKTDSLLANVELKDAVYDAVGMRLFLRSANKVWEIVLKGNHDQLWQLYLSRSCDSSQDVLLRQRFFAAACQTAVTVTQLNTALYLRGFFLLKENLESEGITCLAECDWVEDIFCRLKNQMREKFLCERFTIMLAAAKSCDNEQSSSILKFELQKVVIFWLWLRCVSAADVEGLITIIYSAAVSMVDATFAAFLGKSLILCGRGDCCALLFMRAKNFSSVISCYLAHGMIDEACDALAKCDVNESSFEDTWCRYLPLLIEHAPVKLLNSLKRSLAKAQKLKISVRVQRLVPSFLLCMAGHTDISSTHVFNLLGSLIYKYGSTSTEIHHCYLILLVEGRDIDGLLFYLRNSECYDVNFAIQLCVQSNLQDAVVILETKLGFVDGITQRSAVSSFTSSNEPGETSSLLGHAWKSALVDELHRSGIEAALHVVDKSNGALCIDDLLFFVDDTAVEKLSNPICSQLEAYSSMCLRQAADYSSTLQAVATSKYQLHEVRKQVYITSIQNCNICNLPLLKKAPDCNYLVYPACRHAVHEKCAAKKIDSIGPAKFNGSSFAGATSSGQIAKLDCVLCGEAAVLEIGVPLI